MDQEPLVIEQINIEQINAGTALIDRLDEHFPITAAFWLKASDEGRWYLYIASDTINDSTKKKSAYGEVISVAAKMSNPNLDPFQVKLVGSANPLAQAAINTHRRFAARVPMHIKGEPFGGVSAEEVYVYPPPPYGADAEKWRGIVIRYWPEPPESSPHWVVEFLWAPLVIVPWGGPERMPRPTQVRVKDGDVIGYLPSERAKSNLTRSDYERKALDVVAPMIQKND